MTQRLTNLAIDKVALVDRGANGRTFAVLKRDGQQEEPVKTAAADDTAVVTKAGDAPAEGSTAQERMTWLQKVAKALGLGPVTEDVAKAQTFGALIAGKELTDALYDGWYSLQDAVWSAVWATDADYVALPIEEKKGLISQSLDEFKAWLLAQMDAGISESGVTKRDNASMAAVATANVEAAVRKVGKKISAARKADLQAALDALTKVLAEAEADSGEEAQKRAQPEEDDMTSDELAKALGTALEPITKRLDAIEAAQKPETVGKADEEGDEDGGLTLPGIAKAFVTIVERLDKIESVRGARQSANGSDPVTAVAKSGAAANGKWSGVL